MNKEFVPYAEALALKELGFDEPWFSVYEKQKINWLDGTYQNHLNWKDVVSAPLYQQAFRWLLKTHNLYAVLIPTITMHWTFKTMTFIEEPVEVPPYKHVEAIDYSTYEEAELACLRKLIELANESI